MKMVIRVLKQSRHLSYQYNFVDQQQLHIHSIRKHCFLNGQSYVYLRLQYTFRGVLQSINVERPV